MGSAPCTLELPRQPDGVHRRRPVDVLWDLHGWWFRDPPRCAVVMLRARSALESRLWLEEEAAAPGFALVVQALKAPP